tara:strand:+ start:748 stop:1029 length:282 start_codon:yes stop_codon:yes gene_type:complete
MSKCVRCDKHEHLENGESYIDLRTLKMSCLYDMSEFDVPFEKNSNGQYTLRVCKPCRADWITTIEMWFNMPQDLSYYQSMTWELYNERKKEGK